MWPCYACFSRHSLSEIRFVTLVEEGFDGGFVVIIVVVFVVVVFLVFFGRGWWGDCGGGIYLYISYIF